MGGGGSGRATDDWLFPRLLLISMSPGLGVVLASLVLKAVRDEAFESTELDLSLLLSVMRWDA